MHAASFKNYRNFNKIMTVHFTGNTGMVEGIHDDFLGSELVEMNTHILP